MLIGITDRELYESEETYLNKISLFLHSEMDYLILRDKGLDEEGYDQLVCDILRNNGSKKSKIIVHSYVATAIKYGIHKVHLPESMLDTPQEKDISFSYSIHLPYENLDALMEKAFFVLVSPVYETTCKPGLMAMDPCLLHGLVDKDQDKIVLLGGLNRPRIQMKQEEGFRHFALRSGLEEYLYG